MGEENGARPRRRRGRRLLITLVVVLVVVGGLLVAADRIGASYAERIVADRVAAEVQRQNARSARPDVTIAGVPFLTQVAAGDYREIRIAMRDVVGPAGNGRTVRLPRLDVTARDVRAPLDALRSGRGDITAKTVTGVGTVDYAQVAELTGQAGLKLSERDGKLVGTAPVQLLGATFQLTGTAAITVDNGVVRIRFADVTAAGLPDVPLVRTFVDSYVRRISVDLKVPELPLKLTVRSVEPRPEGLRVTAAAADVPLSSGT